MKIIHNVLSISFIFCAGLFSTIRPMEYVDSAYDPIYPLSRTIIKAFEHLDDPNYLIFIETLLQDGAHNPNEFSQFDANFIELSDHEGNNATIKPFLQLTPLAVVLSAWFKNNDKIKQKFELGKNIIDLLFKYGVVPNGNNVLDVYQDSHRGLVQFKMSEAELMMVSIANKLDVSDEVKNYSVHFLERMYFHHKQAVSLNCLLAGLMFLIEIPLEMPSVLIFGFYIRDFEGEERVKAMNAIGQALLWRVAPMVGPNTILIKSCQLSWNSYHFVERFLLPEGADPNLDPESIDHIDPFAQLLSLYSVSDHRDEYGEIIISFLKLLLEYNLDKDRALTTLKDFKQGIDNEALYQDLLNILQGEVDEF